MKRLNFILTAAATMAFAGCANDVTVVGDNGVADETTGTAIGFGFTVPNQTRTSLSGADAATKLNNEFVVFGVKHTSNGESTDDQNTFTNYVVKYTANSAGKTESNTNNWEYDGVAPYVSTKVYPAITSTTQSVKYWDYSADKGYTFTAFSGVEILEGENAGKFEKTTTGSTDYDNGYTVTVPKDADLSNIYFSDRTPVEKRNYGKPVVLTFRNFGARVRVGFYETVPGYSVKIDNFYYDSDATTSGETPTAPVTKFNNMTDKPSNGEFVAALQNVNKGVANGNQVSVTYYGSGAENENQPKVNVGSGATYGYTLTLGSNITGKELGTDANGAIYDQTNKDYTLVYPNLELANPMLIRCDYTLTSTDGSGETIKVKNARVTVPTQYCQWKSNFAYTYLFKISNNSNGTTGKDPSDKDNPSEDPEGLFPITFDAVTIESTDYAQETTTTVATNSVTSYAKDGYVSGKDIYFVNTSTTATDHAVIAPTGIADVASASVSSQDAAQKVNIYKLTWNNSNTPVEGDVIAQLTGLKNGLTLTEQATSETSSPVSLSQTVLSADGTSLDFGQNGAVKFTPSEVGNYAYVYCTTKYSPAVYSENAATTYTANTTYYDKTNDGIYYVASGIVDEASFNKYVATEGHNLYTQTSKATPGVYDVKVITVQAAQ